MSFPRITVFLFSAASFLLVQAHAAPVAAELPTHSTLPVTFTQTISAAKVKQGDLVRARTLQVVRLADGRTVPAGALVSGHVLSAAAFRHDGTPYAKQHAGSLSIRIDSLEFEGGQIPLHVILRAMANPIATWDAAKAQPSDMDPVSTTTQVGGDLLTPSEKEIRNQDGDVVGYNKEGGAYAHLIANGEGSLSCDAGGAEQPVSLFSASACGLYGFGRVSLDRDGVSGIDLTSTHTTPEIPEHTTALLETTASSDSGK